MKIAYRKLTVNVPTSALSHEVVATLNRMTRLAGGVTVHTADGYWYDSEDYKQHDAVRVYSWALSESTDMALWCAEIRKLYARMFAAGEQTVYVEQLSQGNFMASIVYHSDVEQDSEH